MTTSPSALSSHLLATGSLPGQRRVALQPAVRRRRQGAALPVVHRLCHELQSPLGAMLLFAQMLDSPDEAALGVEQQERARAIEQAGRQMMRMIRSVLEDARRARATPRTHPSVWTRPPLCS